MPQKKHTAKKKPAKKAVSKPVSLSVIPDQLAPLVIRLRRENVILDSDIAELYGISVGQLNQAVKRNIERFPTDFMFQISDEEQENLKSQIVISSLRSQNATSGSHGGRRSLPYAFTEQGVAMLSSVLRSPRAVEVNIAIMRTFVQLRSLMQSNKLLAEKIESLEKKYDQNFRSWLGLVVPVRRGDILSPLFRRRIHPHPKNSASTPSSPKPLPPRRFATSAPLR